uniref:TBCC domain-containing protein n=1 Tax=Echinostoma caproni TaxID=27848 RepID=A0A183B518_9TREM
LSPNPFSVENCIRNGRRLQWRLPYQAGMEGVPNANADGQQQQDTSKRQRIATNAHQSNQCFSIVHILFQQQVGHYVDDFTTNYRKDKCRKLTIVLGPIENTLQLNHCEDCLIISACRRAVLVGCRRCTLHLCIQSRPVLIQPPLPSVNTAAASTASTGVTGSGGSSAPSQTSSAPGTPTPAAAVTQLGNEEILLAPYHTTYLKLVDHMIRVNLSAKVNYWDKPFLLGEFLSLT